MPGVRSATTNWWSERGPRIGPVPVRSVDGVNVIVVSSGDDEGRIGRRFPDDGRSELGTPERRAQLGDEFLRAVCVVTETARQITPETRPVSGPMQMLMRRGRVEVLDPREPVEPGQADHIVTRPIAGSITTDTHIGTNPNEELLSRVDPLEHSDTRSRRWCERGTVDLLEREHTDRPRHQAATSRPDPATN